MFAGIPSNQRIFVNIKKIKQKYGPPALWMLRDGSYRNLSISDWLWGPKAFTNVNEDLLNWIGYWSSKRGFECFALLPVDFDTFGVHLSLDVVPCDNTPSIALCVKGKRQLILLWQVSLNIIIRFELKLTMVM